MPERLTISLRRGRPAEQLLWLVPALLVGATFLRDAQLSRTAERAVDTLLLLLAVALAVVLVSAPRRLTYTLTPTTLDVHRFSGTRRFPLAGLAARRSSGRLGARLAGVHLPGYLTGRFQLLHDERGVREVDVAAAAAQGGVLLRGGTSRPLFLTPADPDAFLAALVKRGARVED